MVVFKNLKNFQIGDRIQCISSYDPHATFEGTICYIHPTNGWLTMVVEKVTRTDNKYEESGSHCPAEKYRASFWFSSAFHASEESKKEQEIVTGSACGVLNRPKRRRRTNETAARSDDPFGISAELERFVG